MRSINLRILCSAFLIFCGAGEIIPAAEAPGERIYRNSQLGIEFGFPSNWVQESCEKIAGSKNCVVFYAKGRDRRLDSDNYALMIEVERVGLEKAIEDDGLFEKVNGKWVTQDGYVPTRARQLSGTGWQGIYAVRPCGLIEHGSYHGAAGTCLLAILSDGSRSASIGTGGMVSPGTVLRRVVRSFRFIK